jgi:hypothetical protein
MHQWLHSNLLGGLLGDVTTFEPCRPFNTVPVWRLLTGVLTYTAAHTS